jgi:hypothetical protein
VTTQTQKAVTFYGDTLIALRFPKALVGQRNRLPIIASCQRPKGVVTLIGWQIGPIDHLARIIDQLGQFDAHNPAAVRFAFAADLLLTAASAPWMNQLDSVGVQYCEERRVG